MFLNNLRKHKTKLLFIIFFCLVLLFNGRQIDSVEGVSFPNGGFESEPGGGSNDWTSFTSGWTWDDSNPHSGTHSARVSRYSGSETGSIHSAFLPISPSTEYTISFWLRTENATWYPRVVVSQYLNDGTSIGPKIIAYTNIGTGTNTWKLVQYHLQSFPNATYLRVRLYLYSDTIGTFWFDDFNLEQGSPALYPYQTGFPVQSSDYGADWLSSPTVADINNDGRNELLIGAGSAINGWDRAGVVLSGYPLQTYDRSIVGQIALADLDQDGRMEIVAGTRAIETEGPCRVFAWQDDGSNMINWPKYVAWNPYDSNSNCWITSVVLADIDGDNDLEILASTTNNGALAPYEPYDTPNLYAWHTNGTLVNENWPNMQPNMTTAIYGAIAVGDVSGDGKPDVVVGRDYLYLNVYSNDGLPLPGWPIRTFVDRNDGNYNTEQRIEFSVNAPIIADLEGDGIMEIIVVGHVQGPGDVSVKLTSALLVLEPDGTRRAGWESAALGDGILAQVDLPWQQPVVADLDGDGQLEIVVATEDGWIRAYKADKTLLWKFDYTKGATLFAAEPVIGDINGDGKFEIVFGTYVPMIIDSDKDGPVGLWALSADGEVVPGFPLIVPTPGIRSAPTLDDLDGDGDLEIIAATRNGQVLVWDTSTQYDSFQMPWPTGRHDIQRSATYKPVSPLEASYKQATPMIAEVGDTVSYSIHIASSTEISESLSLTDIIPPGLSYVAGTLHATSGTVNIEGSEITWNGTLPGNLIVDITYDAKIVTVQPGLLTNSAIITIGANESITRSAVVYANLLDYYLPAFYK